MIVEGTDVELYIFDTLIGCGTNLSISCSYETLEVTKAGGRWFEFIPVKMQWSLDHESIVIYGTNDNIEAIWDYYVAREPVFVEASTDNVLLPRFYGNALITSFQKLAPLNEVARCQITMTGKGKLNLEIPDDHIFDYTFDLTFN